MEGGVQEATAPQRPEPVPHTEQRLLHPSAACVTEGPSCPPESAAKDGRRPALTTRTALRPPGPCPAPLSSAPPPPSRAGVTGLCACWTPHPPLSRPPEGAPLRGLITCPGGSLHHPPPPYGVTDTGSPLSKVGSAPSCADSDRTASLPGAQRVWRASRHAPRCRGGGVCVPGWSPERPVPTDGPGAPPGPGARPGRCPRERTAPWRTLGRAACRLPSSRPRAAARPGSSTGRSRHGPPHLRPAPPGPVLSGVRPTAARGALPTAPGDAPVGQERSEPPPAASPRATDLRGFSRPSLGPVRPAASATVFNPGHFPHVLTDAAATGHGGTPDGRAGVLREH